MDGGIDMTTKQGNRWDSKREEIENSIDELLEKRPENEDILLIMKELLRSSKVRTSIEEYYEDTK